MFLRWLIANNQIDLFGTCKIYMSNCKIDLPVFDQTKSLVIDHGVGPRFINFYI